MRHIELNTHLCTLPHLYPTVCELLTWFCPIRLISLISFGNFIVQKLHCHHVLVQNYIGLMIYFHNIYYRFTNWPQDYEPVTDGSQCVTTHHRNNTNTGYNQGEWRTLSRCEREQVYICKAPTTTTEVATTTKVQKTTTDAVTTSSTTRNQCFYYTVLLNTMDTPLSDTNLNTCLTIPRNVKAVTKVVKMELLPECVDTVQNDTVSLFKTLFCSCSRSVLPCCAC